MSVVVVGTAKNRELVMRIASLAVAAAAAFATPASAAVVDFTNIKATWFDAVTTGGGVTYTGNGTSSAKVRWGNSQGQGQSGYDFESIAIPSLSVSPPGGSAETSIGVFRHHNNPITGTSLTSIKLMFNTDILIDSNPYGNVTFVYSFTHDETTNSLNPCPYGGANNQGVNINGCADKVTVNFNQQSDGFTIDGYEYALDVFGFLVGGNPATNFLTVEKKTNEAYLRGKLVLYSEAGGVPEPATWATLIVGFGLIGVSARRRKAEPRHELG